MKLAQLLFLVALGAAAASAQQYILEGTPVGTVLGQKIARSNLPVPTTYIPFLFETRMPFAAQVGGFRLPTPLSDVAPAVGMDVGMTVGIIPTPPKTKPRATKPVKLGLSHN